MIMMDSISILSLINKKLAMWMKYIIYQTLEFDISIVDSGIVSCFFIKNQ